MGLETMTSDPPRYFPLLCGSRCSSHAHTPSATPVDTETLSASSSSSTDTHTYLVVFSPVSILNHRTCTSYLLLLLPHLYVSPVHLTCCCCDQLSNNRTMAVKKGAPTSNGSPVHYFLPYLVSVAASLVWYVPAEVPSLVGMVLKCVPIVCLKVFLVVLERGRREANLGLAWPEDLFLVGLAFFGLAQITYIVAFGFSKVSWVVGTALHGGNLLVMMAILPGLPDAVMKIALTFYSFVLVTMIWRAMDRARLRKDLPAERRLCTAAGAVIFVISDVSIAVLQVGRLMPRVYCEFIVLSTYYTAQFLLVLGAAQTFWARRTPVFKVK
ncbi:Lysoplasmalogenase-like [Homarus americanus]|uniref:lysoplasmalogenase n=1 Tax=Homarus americanus TaxID=6706 RepID=A0A8J5JZ11_HOMAM|nr:Lysoplasmalogenase-like [Homarus americanus]